MAFPSLVQRRENDAMGKRRHARGRQCLRSGDEQPVATAVQVQRVHRSVEPSPDRASGSPKPLRVFVAMSFRADKEPALVDYFEAMKRAARATGLPLELVRIDLVDGDYEISQKIMREMDECEIVMADFTLSPSNVYFEIGYARGRQKYIIQTARKDTSLEFDVRNWRTIFYRNATELQQMLERSLIVAYAEIVTS